MRTTAEVFLAFLRLGLSSFGGPIAHLGYFRTEFVDRRRWLSDADYAELVALAQFLPGPFSSQVGFGLGVLRGGPAGGLAAWTGFTLPSAVVMAAAAAGIAVWQPALDSGWIAGLKLAAVAVVAHALWGMGRNLCRTWPARAMAVAAASACGLLPFSTTQIAVIAAAAMVGWTSRGARGDPWRLGVAGAAAEAARRPMGRVVPLVCAGLVPALLVLLPLAVWLMPGDGAGAWLRLADTLYRAGALVFGGGHVVLPFLHAELVPTGILSGDLFTAGYGLAQAIPGPLFTFAAFVGQAADPPGAGAGAAAAAVALVAVFLPGIGLVLAVWPVWGRVRTLPGARAALAAVNAAVVGVLLAAFIDPISATSVTGPVRLLIALTGFAALVGLRAPPWLVVAGSAVAGGLLDLALG